MPFIIKKDTGIIPANPHSHFRSMREWRNLS